MDSYIQLVCLVISFFFGVLIYYFNKFNSILVKNKNIILKIVISLLGLNILALAYVVFLFLINGGVLHIYFIFLMILGYLFFYVKKCK